MTFQHEFRKYFGEPKVKFFASLLDKIKECFMVKLLNFN